MTPGLDRTAIPGTVTLVDLEHVLATRHADRGDSDIVLIPEPSNDPDDPLNWAPWRKTLSTICVSVYTLFAGIACSVVYSVLTQLSDATGVSVDTLNEGTGPYIHTNGQWIARSILSGFFTAPIEALPEVTVTDVYFTHERGTYMALYAFFLAGSNYFAPVICGFIAQYQGWQWVFYWPSIFCAFSIVFLFFFMEETNYVREKPSVAEVTPTEASSRTSEQGEKEKRPADVAQQSDTECGVIYPKKTYLQKLSLLGPRLPRNNMFRRFYHTLYYLSWPVVFYAGSLFTGRFSDWLTVRLARRNNGVMEAEQRLWPFAICLLLVPGSLLLWGVGAAHEVHWFGLIVAMCLLALANTCGITLSVNYLVDSYRELSGDAMASVILVRNTMSFAMGYGITPWVNHLGYQNCFISAAFVGMACAAVFLVMIKWGKSFRMHSREKYWRIVEENWARGMGH
ncbi:MFS transporter [Aspergillus luchuensis]|uniref:MFS transporter n=1 Tax=Aspergillus kawachii TaxID=1069201 RepID=A0A146FSV0_ASPKA|nr:MFS transporter [Aspergillus luchuensis]